MRPSQVKDVIKDAIESPKDFPPIFLWGGPGIGKSSILKQAAQEKGVDFIDIRALYYDSVDFRGTPVPTVLVKGKKVPVTVFRLGDYEAMDGSLPVSTEWFPSGILPADPNWKGVIAFDELLLAPPIVTNSMLQLVLDRRLGEYRLPDGGYITAASNRETEAVGVYRLSPPLGNRFVHVDFDVDVEEWVAWAVVNDISPQVIAFLSKFKPDLLYKFDQNKKAFPTPRSYEFCSKVIQNNLPKDLKFELIRGCIGEGAAMELRSFLDIWGKLPDLDLILAGKDIIPEQIDIMYAVVVGLVSKSKKQEHYDRLLVYALQLQREFSIYLIKLLFAKSKDMVVNSKSWRQVADTLVIEEKILT